ENEELFNDTSWFAVMVGQGLKYRRYDPVAELLSIEETRARLAQIQNAVANSADYMPNHRQFIAEHCAAWARRKKKAGADRSPPRPTRKTPLPGQPSISSSSLPLVSLMNFCTRKMLITALTV